MAPAKQQKRTPAMAAVSVRLPAEMLAWLNDQAAINETSMGDEVRTAIAQAMHRAGDLEEYGIPIVHEGDPEP